uniref:16S rRNA (uracil(1498)-N(3))-methyltransferase n=1 Tax=Oryza meridionalis TaxID=40149 RepID=A0A0E0D633_9ORYZ
MSPAATFSALLRGLPPPRGRRLLVAAARAHSTAGGSRARGGLPRFHSPTLPSSKASARFIRCPLLGCSTRIAFQGDVVRIQGDEFWHMTRVLRLGINDRVELFDGAGGLVEGSIQKVDKGGSDVKLLEDARLIAPDGIQWHVYAAFGTLKGGRADWLVEKCTELGACSVTPLLTERCHTVAENRVDRLQRLVLAAVKQCQRIHGMLLNPPIQIADLQTVVSQSKLAFLASAESPPLLSTLPKSCNEESGLLIVGPEGDFTEEEVNVLKAAGAVPVGLGPCRLRVETATISLLSALMLWSDVHRQETLKRR